ncbi:MAG: hypothetical protein KIS96_11560 [Bauldia sp.]|nr:hypothetical protein [Bauldia sp.]
MLNIETASAYVRNQHAGYGETVQIQSAREGSEDGIPTVEITALLPDGRTANWTVWFEPMFGRLYGEW